MAELTEQLRIWSNADLTFLESELIIEKIQRRCAEAASRIEELEAADRYANLISIIADIRERSGLGGYPMLSELADAIGSKLAEAESRALRAEQERDEAYERAVKCIPTNWCDELLTGPKAPRGPLDCQAIERLLLEIIKRIRRLAAETEKEGK